MWYWGSTCKQCRCNLISSQKVTYSNLYTVVPTIYYPVDFVQGVLAFEACAGHKWIWGIRASGKRNDALAWVPTSPPICKVSLAIRILCYGITVRQHRKQCSEVTPAPPTSASYTPNFSQKVSLPLSICAKLTPPLLTTTSDFLLICRIIWKEVFFYYYYYFFYQ